MNPLLMSPRTGLQLRSLALPALCQAVRAAPRATAREAARGGGCSATLAVRRRTRVARLHHRHGAGLPSHTILQLGGTRPAVEPLASIPQGMSLRWAASLCPWTIAYFNARGTWCVRSGPATGGRRADVHRPTTSLIARRSCQCTTPAGT
eukprot:scaffold232893_cov30-Tisochrysis_lutea.AAC.4